MSDLVGYYRDGEKVRGPFSPSDLMRMVSEGTITASTLIRRGKDGQWIEAKRVRGLSRKLSETAELLGGDGLPQNAPSVTLAEESVHSLPQQKKLGALEYLSSAIADCCHRFGTLIVAITRKFNALDLGRSVSAKHRIKLMVIGSVICLSVLGYFLVASTRHARMRALIDAVKRDEFRSIGLEKRPTAQPVEKLPITGELLDAAISCQAELLEKELRLWDRLIEDHERLFRYVPAGNPPDDLEHWYRSCQSLAKRFNASLEDVVEASIETFRWKKQQKADFYQTSAGLPLLDLDYLDPPKGFENSFRERQTWGRVWQEVSMVHRDSARTFLAKDDRDWRLLRFEGWTPPENAEKFVIKGVGAFAGEELRDDENGKQVRTVVIKFLCDEDELKRAVVQARGHEKRFRSQ